MTLPAGELEALAVSLGATGARVVEAGRVAVRDELAALCREPGCPGFGRSASCPPHVAGPVGFRELLARSTHALVVVLEVETAWLLGEGRLEVFRLLHEIVSSAERRAVDLGLGEPRAFAGGSCRELFCEAEPDCAVLSGRGVCRHGDLARPSMSGHGVDVTRLVEAAGFAMRRALREGAGAAPGTSPVVGLLLFRI